MLFLSCAGRHIKKQFRNSKPTTGLILKNMAKEKKIIRDIIPKSEVGNSEFMNLSEDNKDFLDKLNNLKKNKPKKDSSAALQASVEKGGGLKKFGIFAAIVIAIIFGGFFYYIQPAKSAIVKITPVSKNVSVSAVLRASQNGGDVYFASIKEEMRKEKNIKADGLVQVQKKASGVIVVYNNFSPASQTLVGSTRFEAPNGKIYRIEKTITVPGLKTEAGKQVAGSIEATVIADKPGEDYNIEFSDFTLPGLRGTPKYTKIYARSKLPIKGGFSGNMPKASEEEVKKTTLELRESLEKDLFEKTKSSLKGNEILLKDGYEIEFTTEASDENQNAGFAVLKENAVFKAAVLNKKNIESYLAGKYLKKDEAGGDFYIKNFEDLNIKIIKKDFLQNEMLFKIEGNADFVSSVKKDELKDSLLSAANYKEIFESYNEIEKAEIKFNPPWKKKLPKNKDKITLEIEE